MKRSTNMLFLGLIVALVGSSVAFATETATTKHGATKFTFIGSDVTAELSQVLFGDGIDGISPGVVRAATAGGEVRWVKSRDKTDELGHRHVFYRQYYRPGKGDVTATQTAVADSVWLHESEVGLHFNENGKLWFVHGAQYEDVATVSNPVINRENDVYEIARSRAVDRPGFHPANMIDVPPEFINSDLSLTQLSLRSTGDGRSFRYVWKTPIRASSGKPYAATLDAETGELLTFYDPTPYDECGHDTDDQDSAVGTSLRGDTRNIWATDLDNPGTYTHEAHKTSSSDSPEIEVYFGTDESDACDEDTRQYRLFPVPSVSGTPTYPTAATYPERFGDDATDALYFTYKTMQTFDDHGRDSWDDSGGIARVVVRADCIYDNQAMFHHYSAGWEDWIWANAVGICTDVSSKLYPEGAAIDIVAHEWGHGVIYEDPGWEYDEDHGAYHEGWADIIGHMVEWDHQTETADFDDPDPEEADWFLGEDRVQVAQYEGVPWRRVDNYSSRVCHYLTSGCESFHDDDEEDGSTYHKVGNRLGVAMYLMSEGGCNPMCEDDDGEEYSDECDGEGGCSNSVYGIGVEKTSRILFKTLTSFVTVNSDWEDFGTLAKTAAYTLYANCPSNWAILEQISAVKAFTAIGHTPGSPNLIPCF